MPDSLPYLSFQALYPYLICLPGKSTFSRATEQQIENQQIGKIESLEVTSDQAPPERVQAPRART